MALHPLDFAPFSFNVEDILSENIVFRTECLVKQLVIMSCVCFMQGEDFVYTRRSGVCSFMLRLFFFLITVRINSISTFLLSFLTGFASLLGLTRMLPGSSKWKKKTLPKLVFECSWMHPNPTTHDESSKPRDEAATEAHVSSPVFLSIQLQDHEILTTTLRKNMFKLWLALG